jgi:uncharacterized protein YutE (UPF0331/DUF86 family)
MYYVNMEQIGSRLRFIPQVVEVCGHLLRRGTDHEERDVYCFAQERVLQLAIEIVTDIGSLMIDGFLMRDASSYEDIVEILRGEAVFPDSLAAPLLELVELRRGLVQEYMRWQREGLHPLIGRLPDLLPEFAECIRSYLKRELGAGAEGID